MVIPLLAQSRFDAYASRNIIGRNHSMVIPLLSQSRFDAYSTWYTIFYAFLHAGYNWFWVCIASYRAEEKAAQQKETASCSNAYSGRVMLI